MAEITKKSLEHLADLARIELTEHESEKLLKDLEKILEHFKELQAVKTENVMPMAGGTTEKNVMREDDGGREPIAGERAREAFPERERGFLKIPPVFE